MELGKKWSVVCVLAVVPGLVISIECPDDWVTYKTSCYLFAFGNRSTFSEAETFCNTANSDAHLVQLETMDENLFVRRHLKAMNAEFHWLGLTDGASEGVWVWNQTGIETSFTDWASGEPNSYEGRNEDCGMFSPYDEYKWGDIECEEGYGNADPVCELQKA